MALGDISLTLRPIKFAWLVDPRERHVLTRVARLSSFLWGGVYNPIIPVFRRLPKYWSDLPTRRLRAQEICRGYVHTFDPDAVVVCCDVDRSVVPNGVEHIVTLTDVSGDLSKSDTPGLGIGLLEVLSDVAEKEFKFQRRDGTRAIVPSYADGGSLFLESVFGEVPPEVKRETYKTLLQRVDAHHIEVSLDNFLETLRGNNFFFSGVVGHHAIQVRRPRAELSRAVFLMDHTNALDIIDYWNLRALGWVVLPIPLAISGSDETCAAVRRFIERYTIAPKQASGLGGRVAILKARSVPDTAHTTFANSLRPVAIDSLFVQNWYPPMWDEFTRRGGRLTCGSISSNKASTQITDETEQIAVKAIHPEFMAEHGGHGARFANDLKISIVGRREFGAEALPPFEKSVATLYGMSMFTDWKIGPSGPTFLGRFADSTIYLRQPTPREVISLALLNRGWKNFEFSTPGNIAYQMVRRLGGPHRVRLIQNLELIKFLESLAAGRDPSEDEKCSKTIDRKLKALAGNATMVRVGDAVRTVREEIAKLHRRPERSAGVVDEAFFGKIKRIAASYPFPCDVHELVERYADAKIFNLGVNVQCSVCGQRSWYAIPGLDYELQCPACLSAFKLPLHDPRSIRWSYKSLGPFALPKQAYGAYAVLLAIDFICNHHRASTTPVLSFRVEKDGTPLESDFMMFYRGSAPWERETEILFGECKTFNRFTAEDVGRMRTIAQNFPGAVLVFATLSQEFSRVDKAILTPFIKSCRRYGKLDRPRNPVLLLTGIELLSAFGPPQSWTNAGGKAKQFADSHPYPATLIDLCDATQQIHLGLPSWWNDWDMEFKRRRQRAS